MLQDHDKALEAIEQLIESEDLASLHLFLEDLHPGDLAYLTSHLDQPYLNTTLEQLKEHQELEEVIFLMDPEPVAYLLKSMQTSQIKLLFSKLDTDDSAKIISLIPPDLAEWVLANMAPEESRETASLLDFPEDTAGRLMAPDYFAMPEDSTVLEAFQDLKKSHDAETVYSIFILDQQKHLVGVCSLRELLTEPNNRKLKEFMQENVISISAETDREDVALVFERHHINALPVVDNQNRMLGIITIDDMIHVLRSEATEDIMKLAGTTADEFTLQSPLKGFLRRMPWLLVSFFGGMITIQTNIYFAALISHVEFLAFITIIAGMGGNIASQSSTIVVRGLATGKILVSELGSVLAKEVMIGLLLGLFFGLMLALMASLQFNEVHFIGISVMAGMLFSMLIAATVGSLMPIVFQRLSIDPAVATGPFVSTTIDNLGLLGYFGSVTLILRFFLVPWKKF